MPLELLLPLIVTVLCMATWVRDWRLYGDNFPRALRASVAAARHAPTRWFIAAAAAMGLLGLAIAPVLVRTLPLTQSIFLLWSLGSVALGTFTWGIHPPALLLLGSSCSTDPVRLAAYLRPAVLGHGIMYFLRPYDKPFMLESMPEQLDRYYLGTMETRYVVSDAEWREVVFPLMDIVPIIAIDARFLSVSLAEEISRVGGKLSLGNKSIVLIHPTQEFELYTLARHLLCTFSEERLQHVVAVKFNQWLKDRISMRA